MSRSKFIVGVLALATVGGLLGGFNMNWSRAPQFPLYGMIIDLCAIPVVIGLVLYVRRLKAASTDEFSVAKKRYAAQNGFIIGFVLFLLSGVFPIFFPISIASSSPASMGRTKAF